MSLYAPRFPWRATCCAHFIPSVCSSQQCFLNPVLCDFTPNTSAVLTIYSDAVCRVMCYPSVRPCKNIVQVTAPNTRSVHLGTAPFLLLVTLPYNTISLTSAVTLGVGHFLWRRDRSVLCPVYWLVFVRYTYWNMFIVRRQNKVFTLTLCSPVVLKNKQKQINNHQKHNFIKTVS